MLWEVAIAGVGGTVTITPQGKTWRFEDGDFVETGEGERSVDPIGDRSMLQLDFFNTTAPVETTEEQTISYGKYALSSGGKTIYVDFRDAGYPYGADGLIDMKAEWDSLEDGAVLEIWSWDRNDREPDQTPFMEK